MTGSEIENQYAISALKAQYLHGVDSKDWKLFGSVFASDAVMDVSAAAEPDMPIANGGIWRGRDTIVQQVSSAMEGITTIHRGFLRTIEFPSETTARTVWAMEDILLRQQDGSLRKILHGYGHYYEECRKLNGVWQYSSVKLTRTYVETF